VTITAGTSTDYNPLADSQIADYTYPGDVSVNDTYVYSGVGNARLTAAPLITLSSNTVGTYFVDYKITRGAVNRTSRITVTVVSGGSITMIAPQVVLADPRNSAAEFPTLQLSGAPNATVCIAQVADSEGSQLQSDPTLTFNLMPGASLSGQWVGSSFAMAGATASVQEVTNSLLASRSQGLVIGGLGSLFVRINASASAVANSDACAGGASAIVEIRPVELDATSELLALIGSGS
jgi:hypothetical protein